MPYHVNTGYPVLTHAYGLGSYGRTGAGLLISSPRNNIGSQGRIYSWMKHNGHGPQYVQFLLSVIPRNPNAGPWTGF